MNCPRVNNGWTPPPLKIPGSAPVQLNYYIPNYMHALHSKSYTDINIVKAQLFDELKEKCSTAIAICTSVPAMSPLYHFEVF